MKKYALMLAVAVVSLSSVTAEAGGWGNNKKSAPLVNVSPSVDLGKIVIGDVLNGNNILSGNIVSGILNGNKTGILSGIGVGILSGNKSYSLKK